jgi:hypothetical protein
MDFNLALKISVCVGLKILSLAAGFFALAVLLHVHIGLVLAAVTSLGLASFLYFVNRYEYGLLWLIFGIAILAFVVTVFGEFAELLPDPGMPDLVKKQDYKSQRARKLEAAIQKRRRQLDKLLSQ